jgi:hypothetical protein
VERMSTSPFFSGPIDIELITMLFANMSIQMLSLEMLWHLSRIRSPDINTTIFIFTRWTFIFWSAGEIKHA